MEAGWLVRRMPRPWGVGENEPVTTVDRLRAWAEPTGSLPRLNARGQAFDALLALLIGAGSVYYLLDNVLGFVDVPARLELGVPPRPLLHVDDADWSLLLLLAVVASGALAFRRRYPLCVLWVVLVAIIA